MKICYSDIDLDDDNNIDDVNDEDGGGGGNDDDDGDDDDDDDDDDSLATTSLRMKIRTKNFAGGWDEIQTDFVDDVEK
ncbi:hypothetical protein PoB_004256200 [Plakobranchus ocellatus]|uniref:Uncharacterized protein n=1 Tax=Plakobranchus ocellatus TaxID=259542 RepID=A0AAV4B9F3_9GAST|nr:hypothetical protein PoB_004256200 [Plakobranchus ocellatus]